MDAAATGSPNSAKRVWRGLPSECSTILIASAVANGGKRSCRDSSPRAISVPMISGRVARNWPSLIADGPICSKARASRCPTAICLIVRARFPAKRARIRRAAGARASYSRGSKASWRARMRAIRNSRPNLVRVRNTSQLPARMHRGNTAREIAVFHLAETLARNRGGKPALSRKASDAFCEIAIGGAVPRHHFTQSRKDGEGIEIVQHIQPRELHFGEFETEKSPARFQHAIRFGEHAIEMRHISNTESNRIGVLAGACDRQVFGVGAEHLEM